MMAFCEQISAKEKLKELRQAKVFFLAFYFLNGVISNTSRVWVWFPMKIIILNKSKTSLGVSAITDFRQTFWFWFTLTSRKKKSRKIAWLESFDQCIFIAACGSISMFSGLGSFDNSFLKSFIIGIKRVI